MESSQRLNKYLALVTGSSRREADDMIAGGRIHINGDVATLGARVDPEHDTILLDNQPLQTAPEFQVVAFHKPRGYVCSRRAQGDAPTIYDLLPKDMASLKPVGRLDRDSSGLLLLTNDGDLAYQMTHPKFHKTKVYDVTLDRDLQPLHRQMISDFGVMLDDGKSKFELERIEATPTRAAGSDVATFSDGSGFPPAASQERQLNQIAASGPEEKEATERRDTDTYWRVTMSEGRNRQIRRTFVALGYTVTTLHRVRFGSYELADLQTGHYKKIEPSSKEDSV